MLKAKENLQGHFSTNQKSGLDLNFNDLRILTGRVRISTNPVASDEKLVLKGQGRPGTTLFHARHGYLTSIPVESRSVLVHHGILERGTPRNFKKGFSRITILRSFLVLAEWCLIPLSRFFILTKEFSITHVGKCNSLKKVANVQAFYRNFPR